MSKPRSTSGVDFLDDLFASSDEDEKATRSRAANRVRNETQKRSGGGGINRNGLERARQVGRGTDSRRGDEPRGERVNHDGVKPLTNTVATVADSILDFFSK